MRRARFCSGGKWGKLRSFGRGWGKNVGGGRGDCLCIVFWFLDVGGRVSDIMDLWYGMGA